MSLLALLPLAACATVPPPVSAGPVAAFGELAMVGPVRVRPLSLVEDSRCPAQVQCVWAGRLRITALIHYRGLSEELQREMILGEPVQLPEGRLTLEGAVPAPVAGQAIPPNAYRFTFRFEN